ncbi:MAG TPA: NTP transferase domain-containing protein [Microbacterium sp.]|nr:NTP transferase domain-containing protein [Microbacterium sp.]
MKAPSSTRFGAILLAGGRASRMGGIDKPGLLVDGVSMRDRAIAAVRSAEAEPVIVVGPASASAAPTATGVRWVREDPPFSGPAAAVVAGLAAMAADAAEWTFLLACDLPRPDAAVAALLDGIVGRDGACLTDAAGRMQWLTGVYRTAALGAAASALPDAGRDQPVRALLSGLAITTLTDPDAGARDVDTWEDYDQLTKEHP